MPALGRAKPIPEGTRRAIEAAIRAGGVTCRGLAAEYGVSPAAVSKIAKDAGIAQPFNRQRTHAATEARVFDAKAERKRAVEALYGDFWRFRDRAWSPYTQVVAAQPEPIFVTTALPPMREQQSAMTSAAICLDKAAALERHDTSDGQSAGKTMINDLFGALGLAYHEQVTAERATAADEQ